MIMTKWPGPRILHSRVAILPMLLMIEHDSDDGDDDDGGDDVDDN